MVVRREFITGSSIYCTAHLLAVNRSLGAQQKRPKIAALTTTYHKYSHAQHIVDRFLEGYGWEGRHHRPEMDVVSLYVEQVGENDLSRERAGRHSQLKIYPTIADALTLGGDSLAVDGVLLIGEHGSYPANDRGQTLYPRYEYFKQIVEVYRQSGRSAPVFNDKHLSWNWDFAKEMYDTAKEMDFGFMAGSSLPVTWRQPSSDLPLGESVKEVVCIWNGGIDGGDFHVFEALQSIVERRAGGETGVKSIQALRGEAFWKASAAGSWEAGGWDDQLLDATLARSHMLTPAKTTYNHVFPTRDDIKRMVPNSYAYRFEYADGLKATVIQFQSTDDQSLVGDPNLAARLDNGEIFSLLFYLPYRSLRNFFSPQVHHIETLFSSGKSPYPVERTLLTTGLTAAGIESLYLEGKKLSTPHLAINYQPVPESLYWRS